MLPYSEQRTRVLDTRRKRRAKTWVVTNARANYLFPPPVLIVSLVDLIGTSWLVVNNTELGKYSALATIIGLLELIC